MKFILLLALALVESSVVQARCPPGVRIVRCFVDPCRVTECKTYPDAICQSNYCGGCNAEYFVNGKKVDCERCPPGVPTVMCKANPCDVTKCKAYPMAKCVANYCGGCNAYFFVNGKKVDCDDSEGSCAAVTCLTDHKCVVKNGKASCKKICKSSSDCPQGAFCQSGICECVRFCPAVVSIPVCGSDGEKHDSLCKLNIAACEKNMVIKPVDCPVLTGCARVRCGFGTICIEENGQAKCSPYYGQLKSDAS